MTGLDKIIHKIQLDTCDTVRNIESESQARCKIIISEAEAEAQAVIAESEAEAEKRYFDILKGAESAANLEKRKNILIAKRNIISAMIDNTVEHFLSLPRNEYFTMIYRLVEIYGLDSDGIITFNKTDLSRLPEDFINKVNSVSKGKLKLNEKPTEIKGGFILTYGRIDVNCSIYSLLNENIDKISDCVAELLF